MDTLDTLKKPLLAAIEMELPEMAEEDDDNISTTWTDARVSQPGTPNEDRLPAGDDL